MGSTTLSQSEIPSHTHEIAGALTGTSGGATGFIGGGNPIFLNNVCKSVGGSQSHTHGLTGSTGDGNSLPPYYVLSMIVRIS